MIELKYFIDLTKDQRSLEVFNIKHLTKAEASNLLFFLEQVKLDLIDREFELGEDGYEFTFEE